MEIVEIRKLRKGGEGGFLTFLDTFSRLGKFGRGKNLCPIGTEKKQKKAVPSGQLFHLQGFPSSISRKGIPTFSQY